MPGFPMNRLAAQRGVVPAALSTLALTLVATSCRSPTQIELTVRTNVPCTRPDGWKGVAIYLGEPGEALEKKSPTLVTSECDASGYVGSLVIAPSGDTGELLGVRVVAGIDRNPEDCQVNGYAGCIVARRTVRFSPHGSLALDISLSADCESEACDAQHTCSNGSCIGDQFVEPPPALADAPSVRCGDDGVRCGTTGDICCLSVDVEHQMTHGRCGAREACPPTNVLLNCDDNADCAGTYPAAAGPISCVLSFKSGYPYWAPTSISASECIPTEPFPAVYGLELCQDRLPCGSLQCIESQGLTDETNLLPGYFWCEVGAH